MCTSSNQPQSLSNAKQKHWRPWEQQPQSDLRRLHNAPKKPTLHSNNSSIRCKINGCNVTFKRESEQKRHARSKHFQKREHCKMCGKVFTRKDNLTRHFKLAHNKDIKPCCKFCSKRLSRRDAVQRHESTCNKNPSKKSTKPTPPEHLTHRERILMKYLKSKQSSSTIGELK